jgi:protein arginine N-methyltransferase 5
MSTRPASIHQSIPLTPQNMRVPSGASAASSMMSARSAVAGSSTDPSSTWEMWDCIRAMCGYHPRLTVSKYCSVSVWHPLICSSREVLIFP